VRSLRGETGGDGVVGYVHTRSAAGLRRKEVIEHLSEIRRAWQFETRRPGTEKSLFLGPGQTRTEEMG
jgi:hypothetical protein